MARGRKKQAGGVGEITDDDPFGLAAGDETPDQLHARRMGLEAAASTRRFVDGDEKPWASYPYETNDFGEVTHCIVCGGEQRRMPSGPVCREGHGGANGYPLGSPELKKPAGGKSTFPAEEEKPRSPVDDFLDETTRAVPLPKEDEGLSRIAEYALTIDIAAEYVRLVERLSLGEAKMADAPTRRRYLDEVERDSLMAERILQVARAHRATWEVEARTRAAVFKADAHKHLEAEKEAGTRKKQITDGDLEDYCAANFADDWRDQAARKMRIDGAVAVLERLVKCYESRQATLRMLAGG